MSDSSLVQFMLEGGFGMYPVLVFGFATLGASVRYAIAPSGSRLPFIGALAGTTIVSMFLGVWTNVGAVMAFLEDPARVPDAQVSRILFQGLKEAGRPGTLGGALLTVAAIAICVGVGRQSGAKQPST
jgi:hypothetical protein